MPQPPVPADPSDVWTWQPFRSEPGRFAVSLPGTPELMTREVETPLGTITNHIHMLSTPVALFVVLYGDVPGVPNLGSSRLAEALLDGGRDHFQAAGAGKRLVRETRLRIGGHPARDLLIASDEIPLTQMRIVVANKRTYQLMVATIDHRRSSEEDKAFYERITRRFLDSFTTDIRHEAGDGITARARASMDRSSKEERGR